MLMSEKFKFIFIHVPKTGGESIRSSLFELNKTCDLELTSFAKHMTAHQAIQRLGSTQWKKYFIFSMVRNPWDQVASYYEHLRKPLYQSYEELKSQYSDFDGLLNPKEACRAALELNFSEWVKIFYQNNSHEIPLLQNQMNWLTSVEGQLAIDFIGRYERLETDWLQVLNQLGCNPIKLSHVNSSQRKPYREYYTDETRAIIAKWGQNEINLFGYSF